MLSCTVRFFQNLNLAEKNQDRQAEPLPALFSDQQSHSCYASITSQKMIFFSDQKSQTPLYELNTSDYSATLNEASNSLTLSDKKSKMPFATINTTAVMLEKLQQPFQNHSDNVVWSLLIDTPYSRPKDSLLTHANRNTNYIGILTLIFVIAVFGKARDIINSHLTYGMIPTYQNGRNEVLLLPLAAVCFIVTVALMMSIEKLAFKGLIPNQAALALEVLNVLQVSAVSTWYYCVYKPYFGTCFMYVAFMVFGVLKLISYAHFMYELRENLLRILRSNGSRDSSKTEISLENLAILQKYTADPSQLVRFSDILYFTFAPVLVYQLWYPRTDRIDKKKAFWFLIKGILFMSLNQYWMNQHMVPAYRRATYTFIHGSSAKFLEQLLDAITTNLVGFLPNFFVTFHYVPNFFAEIMRFSNREFYGEWWNCRNVSEFWNRWNSMIHKHFTRHIYKPLRRRGYSKLTATLGVFVLSGLLHEFMYSAPLGMVNYYSIIFFSVQGLFIITEIKFSDACKKYYPVNIVLYIVMSSIMMSYFTVMYWVQYAKTNEGAQIISA